MGCCGWSAADREDRSAPPVAGSEVVDRHRTRAEDALMAATGGAPLCRLGEGPRADGPKRAEGRLAAVGELGRVAARAPWRDLTTLTEERLAAWERQRLAATGRGVAWEAYRAGGVAELRSILDELSSP